MTFSAVNLPHRFEGFNHTYTRAIQMYKYMNVRSMNMLSYYDPFDNNKSCSRRRARRIGVGRRGGKKPYGRTVYGSLRQNARQSGDAYIHLASRPVDIYNKLCDTRASCIIPCADIHAGVYLYVIYMHENTIISRLMPRTWSDRWRDIGGGRRATDNERGIECIVYVRLVCPELEER